jgi:hypothetical protein
VENRGQGRRKFFETNSAFSTLNRGGTSLIALPTAWT